MRWILRLLSGGGIYHFYSCVNGQNQSHDLTCNEYGGYIQLSLKDGKQTFWTILHSTKASFRVHLLKINWFCSCISVLISCTLVERVPQSAMLGGTVRLSQTLFRNKLPEGCKNTSLHSGQVGSGGESTWRRDCWSWHSMKSYISYWYWN